MPVIIKRTIKKQRIRNDKMMLNKSINMKDGIFSHFRCEFLNYLSLCPLHLLGVFQDTTLNWIVKQTNFLWDLPLFKTTVAFPSIARIGQPCSVVLMQIYFYVLF